MIKSEIVYRKLQGSYIMSMQACIIFDEDNMNAGLFQRERERERESYDMDIMQKYKQIEVEL